MAKDKPSVNAVVVDENKDTTMHLEFPDADELRDMFPDIELDEEIEINVVGRVTDMHLSDNREFSHGGLTLRVISINGESGKQKDNREELEDMSKEN